jgi:hypothetical protein
MTGDRVLAARGVRGWRRRKTPEMNTCGSAVPKLHGRCCLALRAAIVAATPSRQKQQMPRQTTAAKYPNARNTMVT